LVSPVLQILTVLRLPLSKYVHDIHGRTWNDCTACATFGLGAAARMSQSFHGSRLEFGLNPKIATPTCGRSVYGRQLPCSASNHGSGGRMGCLGRKSSRHDY
jgi:hypothetical protein